ncbi:MAG: diaminopimelate epimerase [Erythrobacter sp.]
MRVPFIKMHGLGNDFIVLDARETALPPMTNDLARALADRREGIGCDQLILLEESVSHAFKMRIFNSDGGEVEACGNASRAVALLHGERAQIETAGGAITLEPAEGGASVDMGAPEFAWDKVPLAFAMDTLNMPVSWSDESGDLDAPIAVNVGNPHVVFFTKDTNAVKLGQIGPEIETDPLFPEGINVNVASVVGDNHLRLNVWERGAGLTRACGTGACATAIAAMKRGLVGRCATVSLPGGDLVIEWRDDNSILMTGPATEAYRGSFEWDDFA